MTRGRHWGGQTDRQRQSLTMDHGRGIIQVNADVTKLTREFES